MMMTSLIVNNIDPMLTVIFFHPAVRRSDEVSLHVPLQGLWRSLRIVRSFDIVIVKERTRQRSNAGGARKYSNCRKDSGIYFYLEGKSGCLLHFDNRVGG
jgi:hypothetical protein